MTSVATVVAVALLIVIGLFQIALAAGAPWGAASWGGQNPGVLPTRLRIASGVAGLVIYPLIGAVVLAAGGVIDDGWLPVDVSVLAWALAGLLGIGAVLNFISRSPIERIWGPVALGIAICFALLAINPQP
jgi:hypothetical protein